MMHFYIDTIVVIIFSLYIFAGEDEKEKIMYNVGIEISEIHIFVCFSLCHLDWRE